MKLATLWLMMFLAGGCAWGQSTAITSPGVVQVGPTPPAPLKCGKYEHVAHSLKPMCYENCWTHWCATDIYTLSEKEWRDLMERDEGDAD